MCQEFGDISSVEQPFSLLSSINFKGENKDIKTKYKVRKTNEAKLLVQLTNIQKEILVGTLLGDASIERNKPNHNARLRFDQTFPNHASYLMNIFSYFYNLAGKGPSIIIRKPDKRTGKIYTHMQFKTLVFPCLNVYHDLFYKDGKKIIPYNIGELLTARGLAYWIMDDGGKSSGSTETILHTRSYTFEEVLFLQQVLKSNFKLYTRLYEKTSGQWVIAIPKRQEIDLKDIVFPYMHYSMLYKV
jgi:hypothetical protein